MPGPDTAVEEIPVLELGIAGLAWGVAFVVAYGLWGAWTSTFGAIFNAIGGVAIPLGVFGKRHPLGFIKDESNKLANTLKHAADASQHNMGYFFHAAGTLIGWQARELAGLAADTLHWAQWMQRVALPKAGHIIGKVTFPWPTIYKFIRKEIEAELPYIERLAHSIAHTIGNEIHGKHAKATSGAIPYPPWVIRLPKRVGQLERDWSGIKARLRKLERAAGATGAVALFTAALAKLGLKWLRCKNVTKAGKAVCSADTQWLTSLLGDALVIASVISVVEFAKELQTIEGEALEICHRLIREFPDPTPNK
jgi:hypothetical protein